MQSLVVKPADPPDGRKLYLGLRAPDAIGDQLGLVGIHERFRQSVVQSISDGADQADHDMVLKRLGVVV